jgi:hypothetical protein
MSDKRLPILCVNVVNRFGVNEDVTRSFCGMRKLPISNAMCRNQEVQSLPESPGEQFWSGFLTLLP